MKKLKLLLIPIMLILVSGMLRAELKSPKQWNAEVPNNAVDIDSNFYFNVNNSLVVDGALLLTITEITTSGLSSTQTLTVTQAGYIIVVATEAITLNLPAVSGNAGLTYEVKLDSVTAVAVYTVTLDPNSSEKIDGASTNTQIDNWFDYLKIVCDGDEWFTFAEKEH